MNNFERPNFYFNGYSILYYYLCYKRERRPRPSATKYICCLFCCRVFGCWRRLVISLYPFTVRYPKERREHICGKIKIQGKHFLVVAGGINESYEYLDSVELLDPLSNEGWILGKVGSKLKLDSSVNNWI